MAFVSTNLDIYGICFKSLCQTKTKGMPECSSQRLCGLAMLSKFVQSSKQKKKSKREKKKKKSKSVWSSKLKNNPK